jgi:hypothetical protein
VLNNYVCLDINKEVEKLKEVKRLNEIERLLDES